MSLALKAYGERGVLAYNLSEPKRLALCRALMKEEPNECIEYIVGYDTVLFIFKRPTPTSKVAEWCSGIRAVRGSRLKGHIHEIPVLYDGPDLTLVAAQTGLSVDEVIAIHSSPVYTVRMMGFTPGFPYLDHLDERLHLPRKGVPHKRIEPGAVAIGGSHAGIYSVASPGGWHLLGHTELPLFDPIQAKGDTPDPQAVFRFSPGERLRFQPLR